MPQKKISLNDAQSRKMFGPLYHGTSQENRAHIARNGFRVVKDRFGADGMSNGYSANGYYALGRVAPIDHLGFGVYLTTSKAVAKRYAGGSAAGMKVYYADVPRLETINFGSSGRMMEWWILNGYNMPAMSRDPEIRFRATVNLTESLASRFDAVWFKGKSLYHLLDGDQIVVFDPRNIYEIDPSLARGLEPGAKVVRNADGMVGIVLGVRPLPAPYRQYHGGADRLLTVRWTRGGTNYNVKPQEISPYQGRGQGRLGCVCE